MRNEAFIQPNYVDDVDYQKCKALFARFMFNFRLFILSTEKWYRPEVCSDIGKIIDVMV